MPKKLIIHITLSNNSRLHNSCARLWHIRDGSPDWIYSNSCILSNTKEHCTSSPSLQL